MASFQFDVTTYSVRLGKGGFNTLSIDCPAMIICFGGKEFRCTFRFCYDDPLPASVFDQTTRFANIFVHARHYPWYVDLLRNERPVQCTIDRDAPGFSRLSTGSEPVGEAEQIIRA